MEGHQQMAQACEVSSSLLDLPGELLVRAAQVLQDVATALRIQPRMYKKPACKHCSQCPLQTAGPHRFLLEPC